MNRKILAKENNVRQTSSIFVFYMICGILNFVKAMICIGQIWKNLVKAIVAV